jgi:lysophospholipase
MRRAIAALLCLFLTACHKPDPALSAFTEPRLPPDIDQQYWPPPGWAFGLMEQPGQPDQRYGVSAAPAIPLGQVVILAGYGETAEMWLETARELNQKGYTAWVLDGPAQGGSGRYRAPRDLGYVRDGQVEPDAIDQFLRKIVRAPAGQPLTVIASGTAWLPALAAFEKRAAGVRLILSAPVEPAAPAAPAGSGKATERAAGQTGWVRTNIDALPRRQRAALGWAIANPDLRMGGQSWGWFTARAHLRDATLAPEKLARIKTPILVLAEQTGVTPCLRMARCEERALAASVPYQQAEDADRGPWLKAILDTLAADHAP